jgi:pimeloyl-ACP methyl ester carboxylesterase
MENFQSFDGCPLHYLSIGEGQPLIFLHGWTASAREWLPFIDQLSEEYECICWDARGHGGHPYPDDAEMSIGAMAQDLQQLIHQRGLRRPIIIGHSMGALTTWEFIRRYGCEQLAGFCIIDQSPKLETDSDWSLGIYTDFDAADNQRFIQRLNEDFAEAVLQLTAYGLNPRIRSSYEADSRGFQQYRQYLKKLPGEQLTRIWQSLSVEDYRPVLAQIDIPCLQVYGDNSQFYSQELARWVADQLADSRLHIYDQADHSPHIWHKERFIYDLQQFCNQLSAAQPESRADG